MKFDKEIPPEVALALLKPINGKLPATCLAEQLDIQVMTFKDESKKVWKEVTWEDYQSLAEHLSVKGKLLFEIQYPEIVLE